MAGEVFTGALGGAGMGASIGSVVGPWGTAAGAVVGAVAGGISASKQVGARDTALERLESIPPFDPLQLEFLDQLRREKRAVESGFTTDFQVATDLNREMLAGGFSVAEDVGALNPALAISMTRQAGRQFNVGVNQALGTVATRGAGLTASMGELINRMSQRKVDLELIKTSQQLGLATSELQTSQVNAAQFAARLPGQVGEIREGFGQIGGFIGGLPRIQGGFVGAPIPPGFASTMSTTAARQVSPALSFPY